MIMYEISYQDRGTHTTLNLFEDTYKLPLIPLARLIFSKLNANLAA